jgi:hypothetical protein
MIREFSWLALGVLEVPKAGLAGSITGCEPAAIGTEGQCRQVLRMLILGRKRYRRRNGTVLADLPSEELAVEG